MPNANAVVDTGTGKPVALPVVGAIEAALFRPDGSLLVRTGLRGSHTLSVIDAHGRLVARSPEPAAVKQATLVSWTG
jgi:hypothetical protein